MLGCQPVNTPIEEGLKLCVEPNLVSTDKGRYQRLVGRLMYLAHTRPDLAYALSVVSQYMHNPGEQHMNTVMRILRRSTSGYFTFVGGNLVTWKSKKQNVVARSSEEAEFRGMALDFPYVTLLIIQYNMIVPKHVEVDRFFIKEKLDDKIVELPKIRSEDQLADILTKAVSSQTPINLHPIARLQGQATDIDLARKEVKNVKAELVYLWHNMFISLESMSQAYEKKNNILSFNLCSRLNSMQNIWESHPTKLKADIRRPKYFSPSEAVEYGIIDKVLYNERSSEDRGVVADLKNAQLI
ncbi:ATP-dependent Clp protease proteolytic subunit-related protein 4, chloroplastic [Vitis vinifera]|uniref:ATP-dependent Clp protease proteolytic subunit-related protein 4, chloroplastic n=1 Tax=Vitis vinifera TaxID=29760 RepID=A0A438K2H6_VITVI|nr:ATP-dependent Clp protease proteolytic subunit-related protein 4, chloroplastic [Vitis vinifera]